MPSHGSPSAHDHEEAEDPFTAGSQFPFKRHSPIAEASAALEGTSNGRSPPRTTRFADELPSSSVRRAFDAPAGGGGDRSPATSTSGGATSPTSVDSRSLLGMLNPRPSPSRGRRGLAQLGRVPEDGRYNGSVSGVEEEEEGEEEDDEDETGPPASLMMGVPEASTSASSPAASPRRHRSRDTRSPSRTPRANAHSVISDSPPGSRSRSPSPSITRHHNPSTPSSSKRPSSRSVARLSGSPKSSPRGQGGIALPSDSQSDSMASDERRMLEDDVGVGDEGVQASTAFFQGARGRRRAGVEAGVGAIGGLFARARVAWEQERQAWGQPKRLWDVDEEVDNGGEGLPPATGSDDRRRRKGKGRRRSTENVPPGGVRLEGSSATSPKSWWTRPAPSGPAGGAGVSAKERALYRWINVDDLDAFLQEAYMYYVGNGIWVIGLSKLLSLMTIGFVIGFSTFLLGCVDYSILRQSHHLSTVIVPRCVSRFSGATLLIFLCFAGFYAWRVLRFGRTVARLLRMKEFFNELLEIPESDLSTVPWHAIVDKLSALRASHPSRLAAAPSTTSSPTGAGATHRLDAHDVANRIMREENYLIALFNDPHVLDLRPPFRLPALLGGGSEGQRMSRTLEWNLVSVLEGFAFDAQGQVRSEILVASRREDLVKQLSRRFISMGLLNVMFIFFIVPYVLMYSFFRYFEEYHSNPSSMGSRNFTQLARWKFREYNELPHIFRARLARSYDASRRYVDQFPKAKTALVARFVAFVAGSFAAVLLLLSVFDPDAFLHFEVVDGGSVVFFIGIFGGVVAIARGMIPKEEHASIDVADLMREIAQYTHYLPQEWRGRLHSVEVHTEFSALFQMRVVIFVQELLSVLVTPFVLWYSLPRCSPAIIDFYRAHTVHIDGLGHICSFAAFDFTQAQNMEEGRPPAEALQSGGNSETQSPNVPQPQRMPATRGKMEKSLLSFQVHHPNWEPSNQAASLYLSRMTTDLQGFAPTGAHARAVLAGGRGGSVMGRSRMWGGSGRHGGVQSGLHSTMAFAPGAGGRPNHGLGFTAAHGGVAPMQRSAYVPNHHRASGSETSQGPPRVGRSVGPRYSGRDLGVEAIDEEDAEEGPGGPPNGTNGAGWAKGTTKANGSAQEGQQSASSADGREDAEDPFGVKFSPASSASPQAERKEVVDTGMGAMLGEVWDRQVGKW